MQQNVDMHESAAAPLGSFPAIFSQALSLGLLSKRRVYKEATQVLSTEQGSLKSLLGRLSCCTLNASQMLVPVQSRNSPTLRVGRNLPALDDLRLSRVGSMKYSSARLRI